MSFQILGEPHIVMAPTIATSAPVFYESILASPLLQSQPSYVQLYNEHLALAKKFAEVENINSTLSRTIASLMPLKAEIESSRNMKAAWQWEKTALTMEFDKLQKKVDVLQDERDSLFVLVQELSNPLEVKRRLEQANQVFQRAQVELATVRTKKQEEEVSVVTEIPPADEMQVNASFKPCPYSTF
jgi:DNA repair exonuclease SbcCD ATPase subunit